MINKTRTILHKSTIKKAYLASVMPKKWSDNELIRFILYFSCPRKELKPLASKLLKQFGNLDNLIHADEDKLLSIEGVDEAAYMSFYMVRELIKRTLSCRITHKNIISCWGDLMDYLRFTMGNLKLENFRVLFLNAKNMLITEELLAVGTVDQTPVYPREIVKKALFHEARSIILVHNHPSGSVKPSMNDIKLTNKIIKACNAIDIKVHDHIIVSNGECFSFKNCLESYDANAKIQEFEYDTRLVNKRYSLGKK